jgi:hypothetical protein
MYKELMAGGRYDPANPKHLTYAQAVNMGYCMNSAALRFVPKEALEKEGYGRYVRLFADQ